MPEFTRSEAKPWAKARVRDFYAAPITPLTRNRSSACFADPAKALAITTLTTGNICSVTT